MKYRHNKKQIENIIEKDKCLIDLDSTVQIKKSNEGKGLEFREKTLLMDGSFLDMDFLGTAPLKDEPKTYHTNFLLEGRRVRGIGYGKMDVYNPRKKEKKSQGWHQNIEDPNTGENLHEPIEGFEISGFKDLVSKSAKMWNINLGYEWQKDLFS